MSPSSLPTPHTTPHGALVPCKAARCPLPSALGMGVCLGHSYSLKMKHGQRAAYCAECDGAGWRESGPPGALSACGRCRGLGVEVAK